MLRNIFLQQLSRQHHHPGTGPHLIKFFLLDDVQMNADLDVDGDFTGLNATLTNDLTCRNVNASTKVMANTVEATQ